MSSTDKAGTTELEEITAEVVSSIGRGMKIIQFLFAVFLTLSIFLLGCCSMKCGFSYELLQL